MQPVEPGSRQQRNLAEPTWVFGYGSLIYKVDFPYLEREVASIRGWQRRFWQGSHDHRGTPESPGRVVTLVPARGVLCRGVAYRVEHQVFEHLDHREKNGYQRFPTQISLDKRCEQVNGVLYVADRDNPAFLGPAPMRELANHIAASHGPSGSNRDYVLQLARSLRELGDEDAHVQELESLLTETLPS
jgi:glutathione-specific gamma-glutamylcyclotransferase